MDGGCGWVGWIDHRGAGRGSVFFMHIIAGRGEQKSKEVKQRSKTTVYDNAYFSLFDWEFIMLRGIKALVFFSFTCFFAKM